MTEGKFHIFGVYEINEGRQLRVLFENEVEIIGDYKINGKWVLDGKIPRNFAFTRRDKRWLRSQKCTFLGIEEPPMIIGETIGLDLPIAIGRSHSIQWTEIAKMELVDLAMTDIRDHAVKIAGLNITLLGPKQGRAKFIRLDFDSGEETTAHDIMLKTAKQLEAAGLLTTTGGVGLFRSGMSKGIPLYYANGYYSLFDAYRYYESLQDSADA
jgi:hypothetical protein